MTEVRWKVEQLEKNCTLTPHYPYLPDNPLLSIDVYVFVFVVYSKWDCSMFIQKQTPSVLKKGFVVSGQLTLWLSNVIRAHSSCPCTAIHSGSLTPRLVLLIVLEWLRTIMGVKGYFSHI